MSAAVVMSLAAILTVNALVLIALLRRRIDRVLALCDERDRFRVVVRSSTWNVGDVQPARLTTAEVREALR